MTIMKIAKKQEIENENNIKFDIYKQHDWLHESQEALESKISNIIAKNDFNEIIPKACRQYTGFEKMSKVFERENYGIIVVHINYKLNSRYINVLYSSKVPYEVHSLIKNELDLFDRIKS